MRVRRRLGGHDPDVTVDKGHCHISVPKVVMRASLDGPWSLPRCAGVLHEQDPILQQAATQTHTQTHTHAHARLLSL